MRKEETQTTNGLCGLGGKFGREWSWLASFSISALPATRQRSAQKATVAAAVVLAWCWLAHGRARSYRVAWARGQHAADTRRHAAQAGVARLAVGDVGSGFLCRWTRARARSR